MSYKVWGLREPKWQGPTHTGASLQTGREFLLRFVTGFPARLDYLASVTDISWVYSRAPLADVHEPMAAFCSWADQLPLWESFRKAGRRARIVVQTPQHADVLKQIERKMRDEPTYELTREGVSMNLDLAMLIGEFFRIRFPWTCWAVETSKRSIFYGQPCVIGFGKKGDDNIPVGQVAYSSLLRGVEACNGLFVELESCLRHNILLLHERPQRMR